MGKRKNSQTRFQRAGPLRHCKGDGADIIRFYEEVSAHRERERGRVREKMLSDPMPVPGDINLDTN